MPKKRLKEKKAHRGTSYRRNDSRAGAASGEAGNATDRPCREQDEAERLCEVLAEQWMGNLLLVRESPVNFLVQENAQKREAHAEPL